MKLPRILAWAFVVLAVSVAPSAWAQDADSDGMPDAWETLYGLNPANSNDAATDLDSDLLRNLAEYEQGTLPNNPDTDGDSLPDGWEVRYGFDPLTPAGALPDLNIAFKGRYDSLGYVADVQVASNVAYLADGTNGLVTVDISTPAAPALLARYDT
jgi:hypothetical protein